MSRAERLLSLMESLRRRRAPTNGATLASELGVSLRSIYRDIASLRAQGAPIDGEAGVGFVLKPGFWLPPLMFSRAELEALVLGSRWVAERGDEELARAARGALSRIIAVLPAELREEADNSSLIVGPGQPIAAGELGIATIRGVIRRERKLRIRYRDTEGRGSERTVWPFALAFFDRVRVVVAWCELRGGFRHFRVDRIDELTALDERYPRRRAELLKAWREAEGVPAP